MLSASIFYGLICMFGYGILSLLNSRGAKSVGGYRLGFLVQVFAFFLTLPLFPFLGKPQVQLSSILSLSILGLIGAITYITFMKAFEKGSISIVSPIVATWSLITSILSFIFLHERIIGLKIIGIVLTIFGVVFLSTNFKKLLTEKKVKLIAGAEWAGITAIGWGINFFLVSFFSKKLGWYITNVGLRFWIFVSLLIITPFFKKNMLQLFSRIPKIVYLITVLDVIFYMFLNIGLEKGEASIVAVLTSAAPLISVILALFILKEKIALLQKIGIIFCLIGVLILSLL